MTISRDAMLRYVPLREEHLDRIMQIEHEAYPEPWTRGMFREEIRSRRSYFRVAFLGRELIGYAGFWLVVDEAHITHVTVVAHHRGKGHGRDQVLHLLEVAKEKQARIATLEVRETNVAARALYDSLGFRGVGLREGYYAKTNENAIVMMKDL